MNPTNRKRELTLQDMLDLANAKETGAFSPEEIAAANRRHDLKYGWSIQWAGVYTNAGRLPETVVGPLGWAP